MVRLGHLESGGSVYSVSDVWKSQATGSDIPKTLKSLKGGTSIQLRNSPCSLETAGVLPLMSNTLDFVEC